MRRQFSLLASKVAFLALSASLVAQTHHASAPAKSPCPWTIFAPIAGAPCPSHLTRLDAPAELVMGVKPLATSRPAVVDGDTIRLEGEKESLRLIGLDCEETFKDAAKRKLAEADWDAYVKAEIQKHDPARPPKYATFMGEAAKDFAAQFFEGVKETRVEWDEPTRKIDGYGRHLTHLLVQRGEQWVSFNVEVVRQGLSPYFVKYGRSARYHEAFAAAEAEAKAQQRGIWAEPGPYKHYGDYPARLAWWSERAATLIEAEALKKTRDDIFILGNDADWKRLLGMAGRTVTVVGTPGDERKKTIQVFNHAKGLDFDIVEDTESAERFDFKKEYGNLLYLTGKLEFYKGTPQFRLSDKTLRISRKPPN